MKRSAQRTLGTAVVAVVFLLSFSGLLFSFNKKLEVTVEQASVYLDPDQNSPIVDTVPKGTILTLGSVLKFRTIFYYVYFTSLKTGKSRAGYVLDSVVDKLFQSVRVIEVANEEDQLRGAFAQSSSLRPPQWGMSREKFLKLAGQPTPQNKPDDDIGILVYRKNILGMDCLVEYVFAENQLVKTKFNFLAEHQNRNQYIEDYNKIKEAFSQKYGKPDAEIVTWQNPLYKEDYFNWGLALYLGHVKLHSQWSSAETEILLYLHKGQDGIFLISEYDGVEFKELAKKLAI